MPQEAPDSAYQTARARAWDSAYRTARETLSAKGYSAALGGSLSAACAHYANEVLRLQERAPENLLALCAAAYGLRLVERN